MAHIATACDVDEIFGILEPYWNYSDYALLNCIIMEFCSTKLQKKDERVQFTSQKVTL